MNKMMNERISVSDPYHFDSDPDPDSDTDPDPR